ARGRRSPVLPAVCPRGIRVRRQRDPLFHDALTVIWALAVILVVVGLAGIVLPAVPGTLLIFAGLLLAAWADGFVRVGAWTITLLGILTVATYFVDVATMAIGMKRLGTTKRA